MKPLTRNKTQERMIEALRIKPLTLTSLATRLRKSPSTISYHLRLLTEKGIIVANETKLYTVAEEGDVEKAILEFVRRSGPPKRSDLTECEDLRIFGSKVHGALQNLVTKGLVTAQDDLIKLTRWGANKLNVCYVCYQPVTGTSLVAFIDETLYMIGETRALSAGPEAITDVLIHPHCFRKLARQIWEDTELPDACFCDYCGLPLSIGVYRILMRGDAYVSLRDLRRHFLKIENEVLGNVEPGSLNSILWSRQNLEELLIKVEEKAKEMGLSYDLTRREQELWRVVCNTNEERNKRAEKIIGALYSPIEIAYSEIATPWENPTIDDVVETRVLQADKSTETFKYVPERGEYTLIVKRESKRLHPYCASILNRENVEAAQTP